MPLYEHRVHEGSLKMILKKLLPETWVQNFQMTLTAFDAGVTGFLPWKEHLQWCHLFLPFSDKATTVSVRLYNSERLVDGCIYCGTSSSYVGSVKGTSHSLTDTIKSAWPKSHFKVLHYTGSSKNTDDFTRGVSSISVFGKQNTSTAVSLKNLSFTQCILKDAAINCIILMPRYRVPLARTHTVQLAT